MKTIDQYYRALEEYPLKTVPRAAQFIVNQAAFESRMKAVDIVNEKYIIRNRWVTGRIQFARSPNTRDLSGIQASMGALPAIDFMRQQEEGFLIRPKKGRKVAVPTAASRISKSIQKKRRTLYRPGMIKNNLRKPSQYKGKNKKARIKKMLMTMAQKKDKRPALVPYRNNPGIYVIRNIRKRQDGTRTFKMMKIYDLSRKQVKIKARPWMAPASKWAYSQFPRIAQTAWNRFLSRL